MPKHLTHEEADKQIKDAMQEPASSRVQRFRELIAQRGGQVEQPFGEEPRPARPIRAPERLPARTTV